MKIGLWKKGLVLGIILLFVGVGLSSVVIAFDNDTEADDVPIGNSDDHKASDDYEEIITLIIGSGSITTEKRLLLFLREVTIRTGVWGSGDISLFGLRLSNGHVEIYREWGNSGSVYVPRFRGLGSPEGYWGNLIGIAFGNIQNNLFYVPY